MDLEPVAKYLESQHLGVLGKSIFIHDMPLDAQNGMILRDRYSGTPIDHYMPGYYNTGFRIAVRSPDFNTGQKLANDVKDTLTMYAERQMGSMRVKSMLPQNLPRPYRRTRANLWEWELEIDVAFVSPS